MLKKKICKRCIEEWARQPSSNLGLQKWNKEDEKRWKNKTLNCMYNTGNISIMEMPQDCKYRLEQTVLNQNVK